MEIGDPLEWDPIEYLCGSAPNHLKAYNAFRHARDIIKGRWPEGERTIITPFASYYEITYGEVLESENEQRLEKAYK